jgi:molybdenum cofactor biosynthesis enzyme MoaA
MNRNLLKYLEIHLVDHCNLNCKGCGHFSTLSSPSFLDILDFEKDLKQLKKHFEFLGQLRLMGGEPLLHPKCAVFFNVARRVFGDARISLVTNGILLPEHDESFNRQLREQNIEVQITFYSETFQDIEE